MFHLVLYQPEIPPNTGNIIRLCANTGSTLHLIKPLGFDLAHAKLKRAGLDYHEFVGVQTHDSLNDLLAMLTSPRVFAFSTRGSAFHDSASYRKGDVLLFGPETRGLPLSLLLDLPEDRRLRIPMCAGQRSLNLSNAAAVVVYEAWRQLGFAGAGDR